MRSLMGLDMVQRLAPSLAARVCNPLSSLTRGFTIDFYGYCYRGETKNHLDWCAYFLKNFAAAEAVLVESIASFVRQSGQPFVCLELGANVGLRTLVMARTADQLITLEPVQGAFERVDEKIRMNRLHHVKLFQMQMDEYAGSLELEVLSPVNFAVIRKDDAPITGAYGSVVVTAVKGDDFLRQNSMPLPHFIRIDGRTDCTRALRGLVETLQQMRPVLLIECPSPRSEQTIDETTLRSVLYEDVEIAAFNDSAFDGTFSIDEVDPTSRKLICFPSSLGQMSEQEACKPLDLGTHPGGGA
ncbi:MAG: FkbM family methyltransferase [Geminicoccaceae bacterium]